MKKNLLKIKGIFSYILLLPLLIIMFPFILFFSLISLPHYNMKKRFGFLTKEGYIYRKIKPSKANYFVKDLIFIKISQDFEYQISYDGGNNYINIYDSEIGTLEERIELIKVMMEYDSAHPVDKQRGDAIDTAQYVIDFLKRNIESISG